MHTSIMVSFNISKATLLKKKEKDSYETPELEFKDKVIDVLGNIVLDVKTCGNMNCYNCSECEDFYNMKDKS